MTAKVFISHSSKDDGFVRALQQALGDQGIQAWIDSRELLPGGLLEPDIIQAIEGAAGFMVVVSPDALQSRWVGKELVGSCIGSAEAAWTRQVSGHSALAERDQARLLEASIEVLGGICFEHPNDVGSSRSDSIFANENCQ